MVACTCTPFRPWGVLALDNQAIVIPETIDAIRALRGTVQDAATSIARTNAAPGIEAALV